MNEIDGNVEGAKGNTHEGVEKLDEVCKKESNFIWNNQFVILGINLAKSCKTKENDYWDCAFNYLNRRHMRHSN